MLCAPSGTQSPTSGAGAGAFIILGKNAPAPTTSGQSLIALAFAHGPKIYGCVQATSYCETLAGFFEF